MDIVKTRKNDKDIVQFNGREYYQTLSIGWERYLYKITPYVHEHVVLDNNNKLMVHHIRSFKEHGGTNVQVRFTIMHGDKEGIEIIY